MQHTYVCITCITNLIFHRYQIEVLKVTSIKRKCHNSKIISISRYLIFRIKIYSFQFYAILSPIEENMNSNKTVCAFMKKTLQHSLTFNLSVTSFFERLIFWTKRDFQAENMEKLANRKLLHLWDVCIAGIYTASTVTLRARGMKATIKADLIRLSTFSYIAPSFPFLRCFVVGDARRHRSLYSFNWKFSGAAKWSSTYTGLAKMMCVNV